MTNEPRRRVFRPGWSEYVAAAFGVLIALKLGFGAVAESDPALAVISAVVGAACLGGAVLLAQRVVIVDDDGLLIRNMFTRRPVGWAQIDHFELGRKDPLPLVGIVVLRDGTRVAMSAIQPPNPIFRPRNRRAQNALEALSASLAEVRSGARPPTPARKA